MWLKKNRPIYLYGYSQFDLVRDKATILRQNGYQVLGYIDQKAPLLRNNQKETILSLEEIPENRNERKRIQIVILLQNALQHSQVKEELFCAGFRDVLSIPLRIETEDDKNMLYSYECFLENDFLERGLFTTEYVNVTDIRAYRDNKNINKPLLEEKEYLSIIQYAFGKMISIDDYCDFMGRRDEKFINDRCRLIEYLRNQYSSNRSYFEAAASHARWREMCFEIIDGHHRAVFLAYMGEKRIPLRIKKEDKESYERWKYVGNNNN